jgi:hypothetical protein
MISKEGGMDAVNRVMENDKEYNSGKCNPSIQKLDE